MLPDPNTAPALYSEELIRSAITVTIGTQLGLPISRRGFGGDIVIGTSVPKAAIDEDSNACARKHDVWPDPVTADLDAVIDSISESTGMQSSAQAHLRSGVSAAIPSHDSNSSELLLRQLVTFEDQWAQRAKGADCEHHAGCGVRWS